MYSICETFVKYLELEWLFPIRGRETNEVSMSDVGDKEKYVGDARARVWGKVSHPVVHPLTQGSPGKGAHGP